MRRPIAAFVCALAWAAGPWSVVFAQHDPAMAARASEEARARMAPLAALAGEWEGSGWYRMAPGEPQQFRQRETVRWAAGNEVLVIDGLGVDPTEDTPVHQAFAMIAWDAEAGEFAMHAYSAGSGPVADTPHIAADSIVWGFTEPRGGKIRFTILLAGDVWREVGEYSPDGAVWYPFMEMELRRVGAGQ